MRSGWMAGIWLVILMIFGVPTSCAQEFTNLSSCTEITQNGNYRLNQSISELLSGKDF